MFPLKSVSNIWRTLEIPIINCEVNLILVWSSTCIITNSLDKGKFKIDETKLYVPVLILSTQDNGKLLQQLRSGFKRIINRNEFLSKPELLAKNTDLNHLVKQFLRRVNGDFVLTYEN